jgi:hypothetical protein
MYSDVVVNNWKKQVLDKLEVRIVTTCNRILLRTGMANEIYDTVIYH